MNWREMVGKELAAAVAAEQSGNAGRARACARRGVGFALEELQRRIPERAYGADFISQLRGLAADGSVPEDVRSAANRLQARISPSFESPSTDPVRDAQMILRYVDSLLG